MLILDTDRISLLERNSAETKVLLARLANTSNTEIATTIITFEEQMRGWLDICSSKVIIVVAISVLKCSLNARANFCFRTVAFEQGNTVGVKN